MHMHLSSDFYLGEIYVDNIFRCEDAAFRQQFGSRFHRFVQPTTPTSGNRIRRVSLHFEHTEHMLTILFSVDATLLLTRSSSQI
jgi:hypothetical protein